MKLAGEFEFLGYAYEGDPEFDAPPAKGSVKLLYPSGAPGLGEGDPAKVRAAFFKCPWWRWGAFKEAATRHEPDRKAVGVYPVATVKPRSTNGDAQGGRTLRAG